MTVKLFGIEFKDEEERDLALLELKENLARITNAENQALSGWDPSDLSPLYKRCDNCWHHKVDCRCES